MQIRRRTHHFSRVFVTRHSSPYFTCYRLTKTMLPATVLVLALSALHVHGQFDPGCSFSNGQCLYNIKLGHENSCDAPGKRQTDTSSSGSTGFQSCSCKDLDTMNANINSLFSSINTLQGNFDKLAKDLNVTQTSLGMKESELATLTAANNNITAMLADKNILLHKSQVDLAQTVSTMNTELDRLRRELIDNNNKLTVCQANLHLVDAQISTPVVSSDYFTHYCDFEDTRKCNYTLGSCSGSSTPCWYQGMGSKNVLSGPREDHTYGTPRGHYMHIDPYQDAIYSYSSTSSSSHTTRTARMESTSFPPAHAYCVRFWYTMYGRDTGSLKVYAKIGSGDGYPIFSKTGEQSTQWKMAQISLDSEYTASSFKLVFEADTSSYYSSGSGSSHQTYHGYGYTSVDDVYVYNTSCSAIPAFPAGARHMSNGNVTSYYTFHVTPTSWYDAVKVCKSQAPNGHLVSVNSYKEQDFLVDTIQTDASYTTAGEYGWYTSGNDERTEGSFVWTDTGYPYTGNYTNWHPGQPNNVANLQQCLLLQYKDANYEWGDVNCADKHPFICEIVV